MLPFIQPNDQLVIQPCQSDTIKPADIVAIYRAGDVICHRILAHWQLGGWHLFFEKGDNQPYGKFIWSNNIIGKISAINNQPPPANKTHLPSGNLTKLIWKSLWGWFKQTWRERRRTSRHN